MFKPRSLNYKEKRKSYLKRENSHTVSIKHSQICNPSENSSGILEYFKKPECNLSRLLKI